MENKYKVVDLCNLCKMDSDIGYLVIKEAKNFTVVHSKPKMIRIAPKRFLEFVYGDTEMVQIILKSPKTGKYNVIEVPCRNEVYDLCRVLREEGIKTKLLNFDIWKNMKKAYSRYMEYVTILDNVLVVEAEDDLKKVVLTNNGKFEDTNIYLRKVSCLHVPSNAEKVLFDKCIAGGPITVNDFDMLLEISKGAIHFDFGKLHIDVDKEKVVLTKYLSGQEEPQEKVMFQLKMERIPDMPIFMSFVLMAEAEGKLISRLNEYFVY